MASGRRSSASDSPWYLRTAALQLLGRASDAEQVLRDAIALLPRSAAMLYLLGVHTAHRGQHDAARLANDHALALHPTEPLLWLQRAALAENESMHGTAAAMLVHVQTLDPALAASHWLATLTRLGERASRAPTPPVQRAVARLTPGSLPTSVNLSLRHQPRCRSRQVSSRPRCDTDSRCSNHQRRVRAPRPAEPNQRSWPLNPQRVWRRR